MAAAQLWRGSSRAASGWERERAMLHLGWKRNDKCGLIHHKVDRGRVARAKTSIRKYINLKMYERGVSKYETIVMALA